MNDFTYIWIAIAIIGWIYKTIKKSKEKTISPIPTYSSEEQPKTTKIKDLLKELVDEYTEIPKERPTKVTEKIVAKPLQRTHKIVQKPKTKLDHFEEYELNNNLKYSNLNWKNKITTPEGAKEAFILSEIFSRKY